MPANTVDCGLIDGVTWELTDDGTLTLSGEGVMPDVDIWPWESYKPQIQKAMIEEGITTISRYVFSDCKALTSVTLPDSLEKIRGYSFFGCSALTDIDIPESVTSIGDLAFIGCTSLREIVFEGNAPYISGGAFNSYINVDAYYPADDASWTAEVLRNYDFLNWHAYVSDTE